MTDKKKTDSTKEAPNASVLYKNTAKVYIQVYSSINQLQSQLEAFKAKAINLEGKLEGLSEMGELDTEKLMAEAKEELVAEQGK